MEPAEPGEFVFHPGEFIADEMVSRKLTPADLVCDGWNEKRIILLLRGKQRITVKFSQHLRTLWGRDTEFWLRLQLQWDAYPRLRTDPPWPRKFS